jgi:hypothetical protein
LIVDALSGGVNPRTSGDHALSRLIGNKAACGRRIVIARWSSLPKHPDRAW